VVVKLCYTINQANIPNTMAIMYIASTVVGAGQNCLFAMKGQAKHIKKQSKKQ
jgi:hypothetical protein